MKKIILTIPIVFSVSMLSINADLEAAGCSSHKNKKVQVECSLTDSNCDSKKSNRVDS